jgi:ABC-2 type transport system permease protein
MIPIIKKEWQQYFSGMLVYLIIIVFLLIRGLVVFILPETGILDGGYATLEPFFSIAPYIMLFLIPAVTMKSFSDEYKTGTFEVLRTSPVSIRDIVTGKYLAGLLVVLSALACTLVYVACIAWLSTDGIDTGGIAGSYIGLFLLCAVYTAIGIFTSSMQQNSVAAFLLSALICFSVYSLFSSLAAAPFLGHKIGYWVSMAGIEVHYQQISKGYIDSRDIIYFLTVIVLFLQLTILNVKNR